MGGEQFGDTLQRVPASSGGGGHSASPTAVFFLFTTGSSFRTHYHICRQGVRPGGSLQLRSRDPAPVRARCERTMSQRWERVNDGGDRNGNRKEGSSSRRKNGNGSGEEMEIKASERKREWKRGERSKRAREFATP